MRAQDADRGNIAIRLETPGGMVMERRGDQVSIGSGAAILGHPLRSLVAAARMAAAGGERLESGSIVMAGAATAAQPLRPGVQVETEVQHLGRVAFSVGPAG